MQTSKFIPDPVNIYKIFTFQNVIIPHVSIWAILRISGLNSPMYSIWK